MAKSKYTEGVLCRDKPRVRGDTACIVFYHATWRGRAPTADDVQRNWDGYVNAPGFTMHNEWTPAEWAKENYDIPMPRPGSKLECFLEL